MEAQKFKAKAGSRVELYNLKTGDKQSFHAIDAKTCLERGGWSREPPVATPQAQVEPDLQEEAPMVTPASDQGEKAEPKGDEPAPARRKAKG